jgi:hypothetical protein
MDRTLVRVKQYVFDHFHNIKCSCCTEDETSRLVIHHLSYTRDSVKYTSFANNTTGRIQYYATLCNEVTRDSVKYTSFANNTTGRIQYYATLCNEVQS